mmetsp:Transcript_33827/g.107896  ORF Transcript_33827/g.107896 Transcript_33827/m.107896 type:complete len:203 (+) Transcript_33827:2153-2761(+)
MRLIGRRFRRCRRPRARNEQAERLARDLDVDAVRRRRAVCGRRSVGLPWGRRLGSCGLAVGAFGRRAAEGDAFDERHEMVDEADLVHKRDERRVAERREGAKGPRRVRWDGAGGGIGGCGGGRIGRRWGEGVGRRRLHGGRLRGGHVPLLEQELGHDAQQQDKTGLALRAAPRAEEIVLGRGEQLEQVTEPAVRHKGAEPSR